MYCLSFKFGVLIGLFSGGEVLPTIFTCLTGYFGTFNFVANVHKMIGEQGMRQNLWLSTGVSAQG